MEKTGFARLKDLVGKTFTVHNVPGYKYKYWSAADGRMIVRDTYEEGFSKKYQVETDHGTLDLGSGQLGNLLEAVFYQGNASLIGRTFEVKSNGKEGKDIRYFFNVKQDATPKPTLEFKPTKSESPDLPPVDQLEPPF